MLIHISHDLPQTYNSPEKKKKTDKCNSTNKLYTCRGRLAHAMPFANHNRSFFSLSSVLNYRFTTAISYHTSPNRYHPTEARASRKKKKTNSNETTWALRWLISNERIMFIFYFTNYILFAPVSAGALSSSHWRFRVCVIWFTFSIKAGAPEYKITKIRRKKRATKVWKLDFNWIVESLRGHTQFAQYTFFGKKTVIITIIDKTGTK